MLKGGAQRIQKVKVAVRVRPTLPNERTVSVLNVEKRSMSIANPKNPDEILNYEFDSCHNSNSSQREFFDNNIKPLIPNVTKGMNTTVLAYGNTGAGKTYTMEGNASNKGIIPRFFESLLRNLEDNPQYDFTIQMSFFEIYNEKVYDLLDVRNQDLQIREDNKRIAIPNLSCKNVRSLEEFNDLFQKGRRNRSTAETKLNKSSSRSHSIIMLQTECVGTFDKSDVVYTKFNLIDLAGSEDNRRTENSGIRLVESGAINKSLFTLGKVVDALNENAIRIPYRDSKLTRILQDSLGGTAYSLLIANISPCYLHTPDTVNTLNFASKSRKILSLQDIEPKKVAVSYTEKKKREDEVFTLDLKVKKTPKKRKKKVPLENILNFFSEQKENQQVPATPFRELQRIK